MLFALGFGLFIACIVAHEFGHAVVMHRYGMRLMDAGIGLPWGPYITLPKKWFAWVGKDFEMRIYLLLLGAYVRAEDETAVLALPYEKRAHVFGAGIIANFLFTVGCIAILAIISEGNGALNFRFMAPQPIMTLLYYGLGVAGILMLFGRKICAYLFPIASVYVLYIVLKFFWGMSMDQVLYNSGGFITIGQIANKAMNIPQAIIFGGMISFALGASNLLPIRLVDGGQIIGAILERCMPSSVVQAYNHCGDAVFLFLIGLMLVGDAYHLFIPL